MEVVSQKSWNFSSSFIAALPANKVLSFLIALSVLFTIHWISRAIYRLLFHPLAGFSGPWYAAVSPLWLSYVTVSGRNCKIFQAMHEKYGPVVRTSPNDLSFASTQAYKDIYGRGVGRKTFRKTEFYEQISLGFETHGIASEPSPEVAARARKALLPIFSPHAIKDYEYHLKEWLGKFLINVAKYGSRPGGVDMTDWLHRLFYDVTADLAFGETTGATDGDAKKGYWMSLVSDNVNVASFVDALGRFPTLMWVLMKFWAKHMVEARQRHVTYCKGAASARIQKEGKGLRRDMLTHLLKEAGVKTMSHDEITSHLSQLVLAGGGTTATCLCATIYRVLRDPGAYRKLMQEILPLFNGSQEITASLVADAKYLTAVIREALRLMPPGCTGFPRYSPGAMVDGRYVPEGAKLQIQPWTMCRSNQFFASADEFIPERWLDPANTDVKEASQPFLLGPRQCIGKALAMDQMKVVVASMFFLFDMELVNPQQDWEGESKTYMTWSNAPLMVSIKPRQGVSEDVFWRGQESS